MDKIRSMDPKHPDFPETIIELQGELLKQRKWEQVLGIGHVFRTNLALDSSTFRAQPYLMEAYALLQFCRYDDAKAVLEQGEYFALKYERKTDAEKIQKAKELEKLSRLYKNLRPPEGAETKFSSNELTWPLREVSSPQIYQVIDKIMIKTESLCRT